MPLELLRHKSWHVLNSDNLQRIKRDEEAEAARQAEARRLAAACATEGKLDALAAAAGRASRSGAGQPAATAGVALAAEGVLRHDVGNDDRRSEEAAAAAAARKAAGIQDLKFSDVVAVAPWYARRGAAASSSSGSAPPRRGGVDADPLAAMQAFVAATRAAGGGAGAELYVPPPAPSLAAAPAPVAAPAAAGGQESAAARTRSRSRSREGRRHHSSRQERHSASGVRSHCSRSVERRSHRHHSERRRSRSPRDGDVGSRARHRRSGGHSRHHRHRHRSSSSEH